MNRFGDTCVMALIKDQSGERYVFTFDDTPEGRTAVLRKFGQFASNPALSFSWYDAAHMSQKVRAMTGATA